MEEQAVVEEQQQQVVMEPVSNGAKYPKTMKRGPLAGQTFQTDGEYKKAMREAHDNGVPKRGRRKAKATVARSKKQGKQGKQGGTYRLQVDLNGLKVVAEGPVTQAQLIELMRLLAVR